MSWALAVAACREQRSTDPGVARWVLSLAHRALVEVYGTDYSVRSLQASECIRRLLDRLEIKSVVWAGMLCVARVYPDLGEVGWAGFWGDDPHVWLVTEFGELVDLTVSQLHQHPAFQRADSPPVPALWWRPLDKWPPIIRYLPTGRVAIRLPAVDQTQLKCVCDTALRQLECEINGPRASATDVGPILTDIDCLNDLDREGLPWLRDCQLFQTVPPPLPGPVAQRYQELLGGELEQPRVLTGSLGNTATERYLAYLARHTFLRLWSYSGLYRDQGTKARGGEGAELCDLLVVFGEHLIVFSIKSCDFPDLPDRDLAWRRWYTRAILRSAKQVWGAEKWLRLHPDRIFLDRACRRRFPLDLPDPEAAKVHRVVVAHDGTGRRRAATGGTGTLMLDPAITGVAHERPSSEGGHPFAIGHVSLNCGFVHVFDEITLDVVLGTLDTVTDLVKYLTRKEALMLGGRLGAFGEEDLLAYYIEHVDESGEHTFPLPKGADKLLLPEGTWMKFQDRPEVLRKHWADRVSYLWDAIIDHIASHAIGGTLEGAAETPLSMHERGLRALASEPRLQRRILASAFREVVYSAGTRRRRIRLVLPSREGGPHYVFLAMDPPPPAAGLSRDDYREYRRGVLVDYCVGVFAARPEASVVVGLASEGTGRDGRSYDLVLVDRKDLSDDDLAEARKVNAREGWFTQMKIHEGSEYEYPDEPQAG